jgi:hypothetical protein
MFPRVDEGFYCITLPMILLPAWLPCFPHAQLERLLHQRETGEAASYRCTHESTAMQRGSLTVGISLGQLLTVDKERAAKAFEASEYNNYT